MHGLICCGGEVSSEDDGLAVEATGRAGAKW